MEQYTVKVFDKNNAMVEEVKADLFSIITPHVGQTQGKGSLNDAIQLAARMIRSSVILIQNYSKKTGINSEKILNDIFFQAFFQTITDEEENIISKYD